MTHWLARLFFAVTGANNEASKQYGFWSGFAGGLQLFEWFALGLLIWWHGTCHASRGCLRRGRYGAADGMFKLCAKHHPDHRQAEGESRLEMIERLHRGLS